MLFVAGALSSVADFIIGDGDLAGAADTTDEDGFVAWAATIGVMTQAVLTAAGVLALRRSRLEAYRWFERALLVNLLVTQVFLFAQDRFAATTGFLLSLGALIVLRILIGSEEREQRENSRAQRPLPATS